MQLTRKVLTVGKLLKGAEDTRYPLSKLRIDPEKKYAECTNGHWLVRVPLESLPADDLPVGYQEVKDPIYLDYDQTQTLLKRIPRNPHIPMCGFQRCTAFSNGGDTQKISFSADVRAGSNADSTSFGLDIPESNWPDTGKVIPRGEPKAKVTISADYLLDLLNACKTTEKKKANMVRLEFFGDGKPIRMTFKAGGDPARTVAILMPMHDKDER